MTLFSRPAKNSPQRSHRPVKLASVGRHVANEWVGEKISRSGVNAASTMSAMGPSDHSSTTATAAALASRVDRRLAIARQPFMPANMSRYSRFR